MLDDQMEHTGLNGRALAEFIVEYEKLDKDRRDVQQEQKELIKLYVDNYSFDAATLRWLNKELREDQQARAMREQMRQAYLDAYNDFGTTDLGRAAAEREERGESGDVEEPGLPSAPPIVVEGEGALPDAVKAAAAEAGVPVETPKEKPARGKALDALAKSRDRKRLSIVTG